MVILVCLNIFIFVMLSDVNNGKFVMFNKLFLVSIRLFLVIFLFMWWMFCLSLILLVNLI